MHILCGVFRQMGRDAVGYNQRVNYHLSEDTCQVPGYTRRSDQINLSNIFLAVIAINLILTGSLVV